MKFSTKILALLVCMVMILTVLPSTVVADAATTLSFGGAGVVNNTLTVRVPEGGTTDITLTINASGEVQSNGGRLRFGFEQTRMTGVSVASPTVGNLQFSGLNRWTDDPTLGTATVRSENVGAYTRGVDINYLSLGGLVNVANLGSVTLRVADPGDTSVTTTISWYYYDLAGLTVTSQDLTVTIERRQGPEVYDVIVLASDDLFPDLDGVISWMSDHSDWSRILVRIGLTDDSYEDFVPYIPGVANQYWFWSPQLHAFDGLVEWTPATIGDLPAIDFELFEGNHIGRKLAFYGAHGALDSDDIITMTDILIAVGLWNGMLVDGSSVPIDITPRMLLSFDVRGEGNISLSGLLNMIDFWNGTTAEMVSVLINNYGRD